VRCISSKQVDDATLATPVHAVVHRADLGARGSFGLFSAEFLGSGGLLLLGLLGELLGHDFHLLLHEVVVELDLADEAAVL